MTYNIIEEMIGNVVAAMRADPLAVASTTNLPFYMFGHRLEIANRLKNKDTTQAGSDSKYPLVCLKVDMPEDLAGDTMSFDLNLLIVTSTLGELNAEQRLEQVFKPTLFPLYDSFMLKLRQSRQFKWDSMQMQNPPHRKINRYFYMSGTEEKDTKQLFSDPTDAIEIKDLKLNRNIKYC